MGIGVDIVVFCDDGEIDIKWFCFWESVVGIGFCWGVVIWECLVVVYDIVFKSERKICEI